jgi:CheY-like chemotaxis protein
VHTFVEAQEFVKWIREWYEANPIDLKISTDESISSRRAVEFDIQSVACKVLNSRRFECPAIAVIDYSMPELNGLAVCQLIDNHPVQKIILTGQMSEHPAIDAFNKRLIDGYQRKLDINGKQPFERLEKSIPEIEESYFSQLSEPYYLMLNDAESTYSFLSSAPIISLVKELKERYRFVEHYVFGRPSGILFVDADGEVKLMVIHGEDGIRTHLDIARDEGADSNFIAGLDAREIIPYFPEGHLYSSEYSDVRKYVKPANCCSDGLNNYYWALFDLHPQALPGKIVSYKTFRAR